MTLAASPSGLQPADYDEIEAALMETARGRGFLAEFARRARAAEADGLRAALARIELRLDALGAPPSVEAVPFVERLEALAWKLRETGVDDFVCGKIEALAREIETGGVVVDNAVSAAAQPQAAPRDVAARPAFQPDDAAPRASLAETQPEFRKPRKEEASAHEPLERPLLSVVDMIAGVASTISIREASPAPEPPPALDPRIDALSWLDGLPLLDRVALFA